MSDYDPTRTEDKNTGRDWQRSDDDGGTSVTQPLIPPPEDPRTSNPYRGEQHEMARVEPNRVDCQSADQTPQKPLSLRERL